jgi:hypothetical protein
VDLAGSGQGAVAGSSECGVEHSGSSRTELFSYHLLTKNENTKIYKKYHFTSSLYGCEMHSISDNGRSARIALGAHPTYNDTHGCRTWSLISKKNAD